MLQWFRSLDAVKNIGARVSFCISKFWPFSGLCMPRMRLQTGLCLVPCWGSSQHPRFPSWWLGACCPFPRNPAPRCWFLASIFGPFGLVDPSEWVYLPPDKSWPTPSRMNLDWRHCCVVVYIVVISLFIKVHKYECHHKAQRLASNTLFTCKHCGSSTSRLVTHCSHLAHHRSPSLSEQVRIFSCVYCDCQSDSIETLEKHVASYHSASEMKYQVHQSSVTYLQVIFHYY